MRRGFASVVLRHLTCPGQDGKDARVIRRIGHLALLLSLHAASLAADSFHPGEIWNDVSGQPIQAHGGGVLQHSNVYYWYGEDRTPGGRGAVACYSSTNL